MDQSLPKIKNLLNTAIAGANAVTQPIAAAGADVGSMIASPFRQTAAYIKAKPELDKLNARKDLSDDQKEAMGNQIMTKYGGETPQQSQSAQRGANLTMDFAQGTGPGMELPSIAGTKLGTKMVAKDAKQAVKDTVDNAALQPGGLQAGFIKTGTAAKNELPAISKPKAIAPHELPGGDPKSISQKAVDLFNNAYTVPTKLAMGALKTQDTARGILAHIKSGMNPDNLEQIPGMVTGADGRVSKMIRSAVSNIPHDIPINDPTAAAKNVLESHKIFVNPDARDDILSDITSAIPLGNSPGTMNPMDALDYARDLEKKAEDIKQGSTYLTNRGDKLVIAQAFHAAADDVMEQIDKAAGGMPIESVKTPQVMQELHAISPRLGQEVGHAQNVSQLRSTIRDFTRFSRMIDQSQGAANSTFGKVARGMQGNTFADNVANAVVSPKATVKNAVGTAISKTLSPFNKTPKDELLAALNEKPSNNPIGKFASSGGNGKGKAIKTTLGGLGITGAVGGAYLLGSEQNKPNSYASGNDQGNKPNDNHTSSTIPQNITSVNDIPTVLNALQNGGDSRNFSVQSPDTIMGADGQTVGLSNTAYQTARQQLVTQQSAAKLNNPQLANEIGGQIANLDAKYNDPMNQKLNESYKQSAVMEHSINTALHTLKDVSPNLSHLFGVGKFSLDTLRQETDPKYDGLKQQLNNIVSGFPAAGEMLKNAKTQKGVENVIKSAHIYMLNEYYSGINEAAGGQEAKGQPVNTRAQLPQSAPAAQSAPPPGINIGGGEPPSMQLPPIK